MARFKPAVVRHLRRAAVIMAIFMAGIFAAEHLIEDRGLSGLPAYGLALIPGLAMAAFFWASGRMIAETDDEFMRMLLVRQHLIAGGFTLGVATVWGTLEMYQLVPRVGVFYIVVVWAAGIFVGMIANRITHGVWGQCP